MKALKNLPLWVVILITVIFVATWFYMSYMIFIQTATGIFFWILMTMTFLIPVMVLWMYYLKIL